MIINEIKKVLHKKIVIEKKKNLLRKHDEKIIYGNSNKLLKELNWRQKISISKTIQDMMDYWRKFYN